MDFAEFEGANGIKVLVNTSQVIFAEPLKDHVGIYRLVVAVLVGPHSILEHQVMVKCSGKELLNKLNHIELRPNFAGLADGIN